MEDDAWGLTADDRAEALSRLRQNAASDQQLPADPISDAAEPDFTAPQSIPHDAMVAGLLAASRIRARSPGPTAEDPWSKGVARLAVMPLPPGFPPDHWRRVCSDAATLLAKWGTEMRRLGWCAEDAFGVDPEACWAAVHQYGLALLINGGQVVEMSAIGATIMTTGDVRHTFTRGRTSGAVPVWSVS